MTEALNRECAHKITLADMERKNAIARLEDKLSYLEKELQEAAKDKEGLAGKLDKAYSEMRDLASKTVESASGVKIIGGPDKGVN